ncbi:MAG: NAD(P)/FAD-dependent oxidoreductase [Spirochaetia bacterium]|nr:NAD(P)/FAD-dependent oxidoreductase [Spirochaetia bacterium]
MSFVGTKYKSAEVDSGYDAIVVGSGMGSLATAALLSKAGKKVLVLEKHYTAGGFTHSYSRHGYEWDVGVHYIGEVHKRLSPLRVLFDLITDGKLEWAYMEENYDSFFFGEERYDFIAGEEKFQANLLRHFPSEKEALKNYVKLIKAANKLAIPFVFSRKLFGDTIGKLASPLSDSILAKYVRRTTGEVLADLTANKKLRGVLAGQWGDYGLPPGKSSFLIHAAVAQHYLDGGNFPVGGASQIARTVEKVIQKGGGKILVNAGVSEILVRNGNAIGVRLENDHEILADRVISGAGYFNTFGKLLSKENAELVQGPANLKTIQPSIGHVCLYTGMKHTAQDLKLPTGNLWLYDDYDHDATMERFLKTPESDFPVVYISFPSAKDPDWERSHPGKSTIDVVAPAPYAWFEKWKGTPWRKRGPGYEEYKEELSQKLLEQVYKHVPQTKGKIDYYELSTPLSTEHFGNYAGGQLYGIDHTVSRFNQDWIRPETAIKNLYVTGQDLLFCGVASALSSGVLTAASILGNDMARVIPGFGNQMRKAS